MKKEFLNKHHVAIVQFQIQQLQIGAITLTVKYFKFNKMKISRIEHFESYANVNSLNKQNYECKYKDYRKT